MQAWRETVDWMYSDPKAEEMYAAKVKQPLSIIKDTVAQFYPKETMQSVEFKDLKGSVADAVKLKFLDQPLTEAQMKEMIVTPPVQK
jgi:NitT/TauT family transport system substrate-binding protein